MSQLFAKSGKLKPGGLSPESLTLILKH